MSTNIRTRSNHWIAIEHPVGHVTFVVARQYVNSSAGSYQIQITIRLTAVAGQIGSGNHSGSPEFILTEIKTCDNASD